MRDYKIITDATSDLSADLYEKLGVDVLPMQLNVEGKTYNHTPEYPEISFSDFYSALRNGKVAKTSQVSYDDSYAMFEGYLKQENDILYLSFSSGLSGSYSTVSLAASDLREKYPDAKIFVVDTLAASVGEGMIVYLTALEKRKGLDIEALRDWVEDYKLHQAHWFTVLDLMFLKRGGRVNAATAVVGTALGIKPVLHTDDNGHLINVSKAIGRRKSLIALADRIETTGIRDRNETIFIGHGDCLEDAEFLADNIRSRFPWIKEIIIEKIGPVIGAHSGPGTVALFFVAEQR